MNSMLVGILLAAVFILVLRAYAEHEKLQRYWHVLLCNTVPSKHKELQFLLMELRQERDRAYAMRQRDRVWYRSQWERQRMKEQAEYYREKTARFRGYRNKQCRCK